MEVPYPGSWKEFPSTLGDLCGSQGCFTAHNGLMKVLSLSQSGANLLLSPEHPRCVRLAPAS